MRTNQGQIEVTNQGAVNDMLGYFVTEIRGGLRMLQGHQSAEAIYGGFERSDHDTIIYRATVWTDHTGAIYHSCGSEFEDDLMALRDGRVNWN